MTFAALRRETDYTVPESALSDCDPEPEPRSLRRRGRASV
jgi:hypothetical protein